ncbi:MAG: hypothetical protein K0S97_2551 [Chloroflexota bacterium]|jgi:hypothetical protein|nr:hypothetical protein [Chloroflexota bacterium]
MDRSTRWIVGILAVLGIVALVAFARGGEERGNPDASPAAITVDMVG